MQATTAVSEILREISAPIRSIRLVAIERLLQEIPPDPEIHKLLGDRLKIEDDEECLRLLRYAQEMISQALVENSRPPDHLPEHPESGNFTSLSAPERLLFLRNLPRKVVLELADQAPEWFAQEKNPIIAGTLIKTFGKVWPQEKLQGLASNLLSFPSSVRIAVLNTLIEKAPDALVRYLPRFLTSDDPKLHLMAIRGLFKIDVPEALKHLEFFLYNENLPSREMAIIDLFHFPFAEIKPVLFSFFSIESDQDLLEKAGTLFEVNPDLEVPYRLWEIAEASSSEKAHLIKRIIQNACRVLRNSDLLKDQMDTYFTQFQTWAQKRGSQRFLQQIFVRLKSLPEEDWTELEPGLSQALKNPIFQKIYPAVFSWALTPNMRSFLEKFSLTSDRPSRASQDAVPDTAAAHSPVEADQQHIRSHQDAAPDHATPAPETVDPVETIFAEKTTFNENTPVEPLSQAFPSTLPEFLKLTERDQKRFFSRFVPAENNLRLDLARQVLNHSEASRKIKAAALRCCGNLKAVEFLELAESWLKSPDEELQIGAINYIAEVNREALSLHLRKCLHATGVRVKIEAVRLLRTFVPKEALSLAKVMLDNRSHSLHEAGLAALAGFEFSIVRDVLYKFLQEEITFAAFESGLCLFRANPDKENVYWLFKLGKELPPERVELVKAAEIQMIEELISLGLLTPDQKSELQTQMEKRLEDEQTEKRQPKKAYAFQTLQKTTPTSDESLAAAWQEMLTQQVTKLKPWMLVLLIPFLGILIRLTSPSVSSQAPAKAPSKTQPSREAPLNPQSASLIGYVASPSAEPYGIHLLTADHRDFLVLGGNDKLLKASPGQQLELQVNIMKICPDGVTIVRFIRVLQEFKAAPSKRKP
ncbi:MAG: HEAT repeat domain-containing protein [Candidatus Ozemobacteraceae bacterium]